MVFISHPLGHKPRHRVDSLVRLDRRAYGGRHHWCFWAQETLRLRTPTLVPGPSILRQVYTSHSLRVKVGLTKPHTGPHKPSLRQLPLIPYRPQLAQSSKAVRATVNFTHLIFHPICTSRSFNGLLYEHISTARVALAEPPHKPFRHVPRAWLRNNDTAGFSPIFFGILAISSYIHRIYTS